MVSMEYPASTLRLLAYRDAPNGDRENAFKKIAARCYLALPKLLERPFSTHTLARMH